MSCAGRGTTRDPKDFYSTPRPAFEPLLPHLPFGVHAPEFFDPCAGDGRLIAWLRDSGRIAHGLDLYPQHQNIYPALATDYLQDNTPREFVLTNPPFSVAFEMCQHALAHADEFMFLLRLSFLESDTRGDWLAAHEPNGLWVLKKRPSFVMSVTCKTEEYHHREFDSSERAKPFTVCKHNWLLPIESPRPKVCPKCGGDKLAISTSDNSGYAWFYWGQRESLHGIHHI